ncbi:MAG: WG repeat-containing protein [Candidatus Acidiferrum sp.]
MTNTGHLAQGASETARISAAVFVALLATATVLRPSLPASAAQASPQQPASAPAKKAADVPPLYPIRVDGKFGYMDRTGKIVVTPQFQRAWDFHDGMARVDSATQGRGIIDSAGKPIFLPQFSWIGNFSEGLAQVTVWDGSVKEGYIDTTGILVIPTTWAFYGYPTSDLMMPAWWRRDRNSDFSEGLAAVRADNGKLGYIDKTGKVVIPPQFLYARPFSEGLAAVANDQFAFGYIDAHGNVVIPLMYQNVYPGNFSEGIARVKATGEITFVDHKNNPQVVVQNNFYFADGDFHDGLAKISENNTSQGFIDHGGHIVVEPHYRYATEFSEGLAAVVDKDGTAGYIDTSGRIVTPLPQDTLGCQFHGGLARVFVDEPTTKAGKTQHHSEMAYIDRSGKYVISPSVHTRAPQVFTLSGLDNCD